MVTTLVRDKMEEPRAIALHPAKGWMFWSGKSKYYVFEISTKNIQLNTLKAYNLTKSVGNNFMLLGQTVVVHNLSSVFSLNHHE